MTINIALLGATGMLGRECANYLINIADVKVVAYVGSTDTKGKNYKDIWENKENKLKSHYGQIWQKLDMDPNLNAEKVIGFDDLLEMSEEVDVVFSFLAPRFGYLDDKLIENGFKVFSNSPHKRLDQDVPLCIPQINPHVIKSSNYIKSPGCCTIGISLALKPFVDKYGLKDINITTFQSLSGRGDALYDNEMVVGNVYPIGKTTENQDVYISNEIRKIYGFDTDVSISVSSNRVYVQRNHSLDIKLKTKLPISSEKEVIDLFEQYSHIIFTDIVGEPRPASLKDSMKIVIGNLVVGTNGAYDAKFTVIVDNIILGAFGNSLNQLSLSKKHDTIGFVGLGNIGWHMAHNLQKKMIATDCLVYTKTNKTAKAHAAEFGTIAINSLKDLRNAKIIFLCLPTHKEVIEVVNELVLNELVLNPDAIIVDTSSSVPEVTQRIEKDIYPIKFVDSPVSGGPYGAKNACLCSMIGGDKDAVNIAKPYISTYSKKIVYTGKSGTAHAVKAINNMMNVCNFTIASRGLLALERAGVNPETALDIINSSTGKSFQTESTIPQQVLTNNFEFGFKLGYMNKDLKNATKLIEDCFQESDIEGSVGSILKSAIEDFGEDADCTMVYKYML